MHSRSVVSLYDESGNMVRPWAIAGYECHCFDILNGYELEEFPSGGSITYHFADLLDADTHALIEILEPGIIFGFPPCTDLATSGSKHFAGKKEADPEYQAKAMALVEIVPYLAHELDVPFFFENPKSMIASLYCPCDYKFDPSDYGGYLPEDDTHPRWPEFIAPRDAYPKETWIWIGNGFLVPPKRPVVTRPGYSDQFLKLGGKSDKTKRIRSETPRGWAQAVYEANRDALS